MVEGSGPRLQPRSFGGLLKDTLVLYRRHFPAFFSIAFIAAIPGILLALVSPGSGSSFSVATLLVSVVLIIPATLLWVLYSGVGPYAVAQALLGRRIVPFECYRRAWRNLVPLGLTETMAFAFFVVPFTLLVGLAVVTSLLGWGWIAAVIVIGGFVVGIPLFIYFMVSWFCISQAIVLEGRKYRGALGRSRGLVRGSWWRVFGIFVALFLLFLPLAIPLLIFVASQGGTVLGSLANNFFGVVVGPFGWTFATLLYFDLRVRKEGYTLEALARELGEPGGPSQEAPQVA